MRTHDEILDDPQASEAELTAVAETLPRAVAQHANCPSGLWWKLLNLYPLDALRSPASPLYLLEDPTAYGSMETEMASNWIHECLNNNALSSLDTQRLSVLALDHAITTYKPFLSEKFYKEIERCLDRRRQVVSGHLKLEKALRLIGIILEAWPDRILAFPSENVRLIAQRATLALEDDTAMEVLLLCADGMACVASENWGSNDWNKAWNDERVWQWKQLLQIWRWTL